MRERALRNAFSLLLLALLLGPATESEATPAGLVAVAADETLELLFDASNGDVAVRDLRCGELWRSDPGLGPEDQGLSQALRDTLGSPFLLSYRDRDMKVSYSANRRSPGVALTVTPLAGGVRATYRIPCEAATAATLDRDAYSGVLGFSIEYKLSGGALSVRVPGESIVEEGDFLLVSLQLLPFFGATAERTDGGLVIPDGRGSVARFRPPAAQSAHVFSIPVYGEERFAFAARRRTLGSLAPEEVSAFLRGFQEAPASAGLPLFGILRRGRGLAAIIDSGQMYARVRGALAGAVFDCSRIGPDFDYRISYVTFLSRSKVSTKYLRERIPGDRGVRYVFLPGPGAGVAEIAGAGRDYLGLEARERGGAEAKCPGVDVRVFCAVGQPRLFGTSLVVATTFAEAGEIVRHALSAGLSNVSLTLVGWETGGYRGRLPRKLPPERTLGGERGLSDLAKTCHELGVPLYLEVDYLLAVAGGRGFRVGRDALAEPSTIALTDGHGAFLISPRSALTRFAPAELPALARLGVDGLLFRHLGEALLSDYGHGFSRAQNLEDWRMLLDAARSAGLEVRVEGGSLWTLGRASALYGAPLSSSGLPFAGEEAGLFDASVHGLVGLISRPVNLEADITGAILTCLELGVSPSLELTAADPVVLKDTSYNGLYRSQYREVITAAAPLLQPASVLLPSLCGRAVVGRSSPAPGVSRTLYEGGAEVIVNRTGAGFSWRGSTVSARDYLILPAGEGAP